MSLNEFTTNEIVEFKGSKKGLIVNVRKMASFEEIKASIIEKLESAIGFFNGAKISAINSEFLSDIQIIQIKEEITSRFDIEFIEPEVEMSKKQLKTRYINNLRSGENIEFEGDVVILADMKPGSKVISKSNVVVMGNIEPGAKVVADGNIIVMGYIKGFIYAGASGNESAYAVAKEFKPKVLQIADNFAEAPEDENYSIEKSLGPEIAFISDGAMVVESYISKSKKKNNVFDFIGG